MTNFESLKLLVVEDHPFQRNSLVRMLRQIGAGTIVEAADGAEALALLASEESVDVVICDLNMPGMDGLEFIRHLGETEHALSVIIISAESSSLLNSAEKMTRAYAVKLLGVVQKPVTREVIEGLLSQYAPSNPGSTPLRPPRTQFSLEEILEGISQQQLEPFFQPMISFADGAVVGAEALARWRKPGYGMVAPCEFIPLLEDSGQIDELTFIMLEKSARACAAWRNAGHDLYVCVNLSLVSLTDASLAARITEVLSRVGLDPRHMVLEVTETAALTEVARAIENLARLRMRGFKLAIDDFGTGFSSLSQITRVPYTALKIDQTFVTGCSTNPTNMAIVNSCIELASKLGIESVAEGIETQADWNALSSAGCMKAQGYFIAKPMEENDFNAFLVSR